MKNILVAYDGGEPAHRALETAMQLAKHFDASLAVVSVVPSTRDGRRSTPGTTGRSTISSWPRPATSSRPRASSPS